jgi:hypothetical protein
MQIETPFFSLALPDGFVEEKDESCHRFVHPSEGLELTVSASTIDATAGVSLDEIVPKLLELRSQAARAILGATFIAEIGAEPGAERLVWTQRGTGTKAPFFFFAIVTHPAPVLEQWFVATASFYRYSVPGKPPIVDALEAEARRIVASIVPLPQQAALRRGEDPDKPIDMERIYPYVVPASYLPTGGDAVPPPELGHGCYVMFAEDFDGAARVLYPENLASEGHGFSDAMKASTRNLARAVSARAVSIARSTAGPRAEPTIVFGPEWLAASCLFLPDLHAFVSEKLGPGPLLCSIPHRDCMIVFRGDDPSYVSEMRTFVETAEADGRKPLTRGLFAIEPGGVRPV